MSDESGEETIKVETTGEAPVERVEVGHLPTAQTVDLPVRERTRGLLAGILLIAFVAMMSIPIVMIWTGRLEMSEGRELMTTIGSVMAGPLGFVLGYYFKSAE